ncbi:Thiamin ABC transporter, transmembrane component [Citrobacter freundii]|uniref:Thiamin ABC transporter, transmembrane component n=1 Tax=Citrobacter freundii TaxID=546 RepID=A0A7G2IJ65_CITFR|nr:Thiamin ABC transporter, transmembrane component [Citrobacter freundii]
MATRRQPLIPGWLVPGLTAATLMVAVALAAFLALWFNAPQESGSRCGKMTTCGTWCAFLSGRLFYPLCCRLSRRFSLPERSIVAVFQDVWRCCVCAQ